jgi:dTDP-4-amino-4,6-dideoxygalactose transaminase
MTIPLLDLNAQYESIREELNAAVLEVLQTQQFILGPTVLELEDRIAEYCGCRHAIGVSSGTDALLISLMAEGTGPGDEVIVPDYSFFATAGAVSRVGATPVFVDIDPRTFNIRSDLIEAAITPRTRAIIPVHLFGHMADMDPVMALAQKHGLTVIEDAAQSIGAEYHGRRAGSIGDYGCLSFFPSKNLGGIGDGGMVVTNDDARAGNLRGLRVHGARQKYYHDVIGGNFRLDAIQAAALLVKIRHLDEWTDRRRANAARYRTEFTAAGLVQQEPSCMAGGCRLQASSCELGSSEGVVLPLQANGCRHVYNQFVLRSGERDRIQKRLVGAGIGSAVYYPLPFHRQECFSQLPSSQGSFPASDCAARTSLAIPVFPELGAGVSEVVSAFTAS